MKRIFAVMALSLTTSGMILPAQRTNYAPPLTLLVRNTSTLVADEEVAKWVAAIQRQVHEHLAAAWKIDAEIVFQGPDIPGAWTCIVEDGPDDPGAPLASHFTRDDGVPGCAVYVRGIMRANRGPASLHLSHEILETLVDPWLGSVTFRRSSIPNGASVYLREICDPVSAYSYEIDGVVVSDFTYPAFWSDRPGVIGQQMDHLRVAALPLEPTAHSYMLVRHITPFGGIDSIETWSYIWGSFCIFGPC